MPVVPWGLARGALGLLWQRLERQYQRGGPGARGSGHPSVFAGQGRTPAPRGFTRVSAGRPALLSVHQGEACVRSALPVLLACPPPLACRATTGTEQSMEKFLRQNSSDKTPVPLAAAARPPRQDLCVCSPQSLLTPPSYVAHAERRRARSSRWKSSFAKTSPTNFGATGCRRKATEAGLMCMLAAKLAHTSLVCCACRTTTGTKQSLEKFLR